MRNLAVKFRVIVIGCLLLGAEDSYHKPPKATQPQKPSATTRSRWRRKTSRNIGEVIRVSARALIGASFGSLAVGETKPQRIGPRRFSPLTETMVSAIWLGRRCSGDASRLRRTVSPQIPWRSPLGYSACDASAHGAFPPALLEHLVRDGEGSTGSKRFQGPLIGQSLIVASQWHQADVVGTRV
jgi:hypothetical protein